MSLNTISYSTLLTIYRYFKTAHRSKKFIIDHLNNYNWNDLTDAPYRENCRQVIEKCFRDMGYNHQLAIIFLKNDQHLVADITHEKINNERLALVRVQYNDPNVLLRNDHIYAIAAHEAAHFFQNAAAIRSIYYSTSTSLMQTVLLKKFLPASLLMGPLEPVTLFSLAIIYFSSEIAAKGVSKVFAGKVSQFTEKDADLTAANTLNVGQSLADYLRETIAFAPKHGRIRSFFDTHPRYEERIRYLEEHAQNGLKYTR